MTSISDTIAPQIHKDFLPFFKKDSLFHLLPKVAVVDSDDYFGRMIRDTSSIQINKINIKDTIANEVLSTYTRLERALSLDLYCGSAKQNNNDSLIKHINGLDYFCKSKIATRKEGVLSEIIKQAKQMLRNNVDIIICMKPYIMKLLNINGNTLPIKFDLVSTVDVKVIGDNCVPLDTIGNGEYREYIYIVPVAVAGDQITTLEYIDQNYKAKISPVHIDYFISDNGLLVWTRKIDKWDLEARVLAEMRLNIDRPELIKRIEFTHKPPKITGKING